jgi:hypothetical protein
MSRALVGAPGHRGRAGLGRRRIAAEHAFPGFHSVNLMLSAAEPAGKVLTDVPGVNDLGRDARRSASRATAQLAAYSKHR